MNHKIRHFQYQKHGAADVLSCIDANIELPAVDDVQIHHTAIGVNYLDIYQRSGADLSISLPSGIGVEGVGIIKAVGANQSRFSPGDRVAYVGGPPGAYSTSRNIPASRVVKLPDWIGDQVAAALIFKGLTAEYLTHRCVDVQAGQSVLFHAAAGGVGSIACQWLHSKGATVIGTVGSEEKVDIAYENGCDHVLLSNDADLVKKVRDLTGGVDVVYDSIGQATFIASLDSLRPRGVLVSFGAASGAPPEIDVSELSKRGSLYLTRPSIAHYTSDAEEYQQAANHLFQAISDGVIKPANITSLPFFAAAKAHLLLEGRKTTGSVILIPEEDNARLAVV
ncbi:quinone oxidoreductase [Roseovarius sp. EL26]|uniref:quinone oxidoreductase family protein n=1 Tax=Roseovarius sp. EL26 TaxID=2126672 RepID=UPI000EA2D5F5|nr:quinone oxidoreductase [Roseovarius sp. EL26]